MKTARKKFLLACSAALLALATLAAVEPPSVAEAESAAVTLDAEARPLVDGVEMSATSVDFGTVSYDHYTHDPFTITITNRTSEWVYTTPITKSTFFIAESDKGSIGKDQTATVTIRLNPNGRPTKAGPIEGTVDFPRRGSADASPITVKLTLQMEDVTFTADPTYEKVYGTTPNLSKVKVQTNLGQKTLTELGLTAPGLGKYSDTDDYDLKSDGTYTFAEALPKLHVEVEPARTIPLGILTPKEYKAGERLDSDVPNVAMGNDDERSDRDIAGTFAWENPSYSMRPVGENTVQTSTQKLTFTPSDTKHYQPYSTNLTVSWRGVKGAAPVISIGGTSQTYDGNPKRVSIQTNSTGERTVLYNGSPTEPTQAGSYDVEVRIAATTDLAEGVAKATLVINKRPVTFFVPNASKAYGRTFPMPGSIDITAGVVKGDTVKATNLHSEGTAATADVDPSGYEITATSSNDNYTVSCSNRLVVTKATPTLTNLSAGSAQAGTQLKDLHVTGTASNPHNGAPVTGEFSWDSGSTPITAGTHTYTVTFKPTGEDESRYESAKGNVRVTASEQPVVNLDVDQESTHLVYDGQEKHVQATTTTQSATLTFEYEVGGRWQTSGPVDAGTYSYRVTARVADGSLAENVHEGKLTITPAPVSGTVTVSGSGSTLAGYHLTPNFEALGTPVSGTATWDAASSTRVEVGVHYAYTFHPTSANYQDYKNTAVAKTDPDAEPVKTDALKAKLDEAQALLGETTVSNDGSDVPQSKWWANQEATSTLLAAIEEGNRDMGASTQAEVDQGLQDLTMAVNSFRNARAKGTQGAGGGGGGGGTGGGGGGSTPAPQKQQSTVNLSATQVSIRPGEDPLVVNVTGQGDGAIFAICDNTNVALVDVRGTTLHIRGRSQGTCEVRVVRSATALWNEASAILVVHVGEPLPGFNPDDVEPEPEIDAKQTFRLFNRSNGEHLYTTDANEAAELVRLGWKQEQTHETAGHSSTPVYRLYNRSSGEHHYTADPNEYKTLGERGWKQEGISFYSDDAKGVKVYRLYNGASGPGSHHSTADSHERDVLVREHGWRDEGVGWYYVS